MALLLSQASDAQHTTVNDFHFEDEALAFLQIHVV
jgi:hypothetical protein